jgi:preprotein translocase subunit YajC
MYLQSPLGGGFGSFGFIMIAMVAVMYFVTIAPNQKKQKAWQAMLDGLKSGDRVTTTGGLRGVILQVKDDCVIVRIQPDNLKIEFVKSAITAVTTDEPKT